MVNPPLGSILRYLNRVVGPSYAELTDGQLLERCWGGQDSRAFETLIQRQGPLVWGVCRRVAQDAQDAEDAFQATFLVLWRKAGSLAIQCSLASWLYGVAYRVALKANTAAARRRQRERQVAQMAQTTAPADSHGQELRAVLDTELNRLPDQYRAPLILCYLEGKTNEQAARELGWPIGSMSKRLARGRELLRERLASQGLAFSTAALGTVLVEQAATAAPPAALVDRTVTVAGLMGKGTTVGVVSEHVSYLTEGVLRTMVLTKVKVMALTALASMTVAASFSVLLAQQPAVPKDPQISAGAAPVPEAVAKAPPAVKLDLTPESFPKLQALVRPQENEWRHLRVHWLTDIVAARKKAAAEDKPLIVYRTGGAGYNDPLGVC